MPLDDAARFVHDREPSRLGSINAKFRGDLETIAAKALAKEKARRYPSAAALASDLRHYLANEPIVARPPSALYQLRKFAKRHKALVGAVAGVLVALVLGIIATSTFALVAADQRRRAEAEKEVALHAVYQARLAAAGAALRDHDVVAAAQHLRAAPMALRNWEWRHLHSRLDESAAVLQAPAGGRIVLASGPGDIRITTTGPDGLHLLDADRHECLALVPWPGLLHVEHTPNATQIYGLDTDQRLCLLDESGKVLFRLTAPAQTGLGVLAVSPDQKRLAVHWQKGNSLPSRIWLYDLPSGEQQTIIPAHDDLIWALAFSADGTRLASGSEDHTARLWDTATGAPLQVFRGHSDKVFGVAFAPDGSRVVTASADHTARQWDPRTGEQVGITYRGHSHELQTAVYSPDGRWIASGGRDHTVRLWDPADGQEVAILHGHTKPISQLAFSPDGSRLASAGADETVRIWEVGKEISLPVLRGHTSYIYPIAYSPDGRWLASGSWDQTVRLWDARTGVCGAVSRHSNLVRALAFSPDSTWLVSGCEDDDQLHIWNVATGQPRQVIAGPGKLLWALAVSRDGTQIAALDGTGTLLITDLATGQKTSWVRRARSSTKDALAYSPDGRWLAGIADGPTIGLWDTRTYQLAAQWTGHTGEIYSVSFSPDGRQLVSAGQDGTVRLWDVATGTSLRILKGHTDDVFAAVFHPDGTRIASGGRDRAIRLWDVATGEEVARLPGHTNYVFDLAFSPDGNTLASGSGDFTVRLWDTVPLSWRLNARREAKAAHGDAEKLVERLFREFKEPSAVVRALNADQTLSETLRREAQHAIWHRLAACE
jgi:WD40 repeat protein